MNVLVLNPDLPVFPGWGGIEFLNTTSLARRVARVGLVSCLHTVEQESRLEPLRRAGVELYLWENPGRSVTTAGPSGPAAPPPAWFRLLHALPPAVRAWRPPWLGRPSDTQMRNRVFRNLAPHVERALSDGPWQALVVIQSSCAHWLDFLPEFPVSALVMHDIRALVFERESRTAAPFARRLAARLEAARYRRFERHYARRYDHVFTVSDVDRAWVARHYAPQRVTTLAIPVDTEYFRQPPDCHEAPNRVVFTGMMNHPPNTDAAVYFARDVLPVVRRTCPDVEFRIVGRNPPQAVCDLASLPNVTVTGLVEDIRPEMAAASVLVVPLRFGSGVRQKILEAWSMGKAVVSTTVGAEGLGYEEGRHLRIGDTPAALAAAVVDTLRSHAVRSALGVSGRALALSAHAPEAVGDRYVAALDQTLREKRETRGPMRAVMDARWMHPGVAGGIEGVARSFLASVDTASPSVRYSVIAPANVVPELRRAFPRVRYIPQHTRRARVAARLLDLERRIYRRLQFDHWRSAAVLRLRRAAALGAEVGFSIPAYIHPDLRPLANVLLVTDFQHEHYPQFFTAPEVEERRRLYGDSIRCADHVLAISEFTRESVLKYVPVDPAKVSVAHLAADDGFLPGSPARARTAVVLESLGLANVPYLLLPGHTWPHKNHKAAIRALRIMGERYGFRPWLVCSGSPRGGHDGLDSLAADLGVADRVRFLGYRPASEMPALYQGARALVFPSLFEGFGMPVLEAMWCGCPVVCSRVTSLPEVAGDAALFVEPDDPEALAEAVFRLEATPSLRETFVRRGLARAAQFSWSRFSGQVDGALRSAWNARWDVQETRS